MLQAEIQKRAEYWSSNSAFDEATRQEIAQLLQHQQNTELNDRFYRDLEFGTGGLRGVLGAGTARMNIYNIRKATSAYARYLKKLYADRSLSIAITFDSRNFSQEFAKATAATFAAHGIRALITKELRPVPMLSFMVRRFECDGGICITASHNPPNYNGYKVYWRTGGQIVPPHDQAVIEEYASITDYAAIPSMDFDVACQKGLIQIVGDELDDSYFAQLKSLRLQAIDWKDFRIAFTPLHGTAGEPVRRAFKMFGFNDVHVVKEQELPDGRFPTVKFPNPEEPEALSMAVALAKDCEADLVLGTDPDCDRVGIVYRKNDKYVFLNGNQIGCLMTEYVLSQMSKMGTLPDLPLVVKTIVTTDLQADIGRFYGCHVDETLTGFKWICQRVEEYDSGKRQPKRIFVCGGEESYGFLVGNFVRDKDGIAACAIAAEMTAYYKSQGKDLDQVLDQLYRRHGVYFESLKTITLPGKEGAERIKTMMASLRSKPPMEIAGSDVNYILDTQTGYSFDPKAPQQKRPAELPTSDVLQFVLSDGAKVSVRPSGTEPKIKFYVSAKIAIDPNCSAELLEKTKIACQSRVAQLEAAFASLASS